ncbi:acyl-CoA dehydrogenase family protein [Flavobacteriaceae bacterium]|jgi:alkylation response protein AidB-like acyl-CoA dehydrogenase|nr:acyl-CoA dehydrogenase [Flavobacteriaceae bacterium]MBT4312920.1 acyl-CoA dehydrogenase [Flavobacteriaceae bacterium]MBT5091832.1 acyl-CoA dehydrogenase [Flavobacteriaceae bacterium]MBT5283362.1 acyl-CoA dehydrogenase [Flavobacteriaceae bacterium]MBT5446636.1 acyl-CoA dehydrogenase [Flavobacteriaceae bacterium]|tara:strand:- start:2013 stop:3176 length:1164 start_codon:yes stop_codon:yes gene_type:complete
MIDFELKPKITTSETQKMVFEAARDFSSQHIQPNIMDWDEAQYFPKDIFEKAGALGFMGMLIPEAYGGSGMGYHEYVTLIETISIVDPSIGLSIAAHNSLCTNHIYTFGTEDQRNRWLPDLCSGVSIGAWGLTEHNTGSDAKGMSTTAKKDGDNWILNGTKNFITHGISGAIAVVIARSGEKGDNRGMTAFVVERGTPGFTSGKKENKLGMRASETAEMVFDNCIIPDQNRLGPIGDGFIQSMKILDGGRISIAALSLGVAKGAFNASLKYSKERKQFGRPISSFQGISFKLADMATEIEAAVLLTEKASELKNQGKNVTQQGAMAKLFASEVCVKVANEAVQIHGGYGFTKDFPVEKFFRDSKLCTIGEGTSEIQKLVISRKLLSE